MTKRSSKTNPDLVAPGTVYGLWTVLGPYVRRGKNNDAWFPCQCECGTTKDVRFRSLNYAARVGGSCGCLQKTAMKYQRTMVNQSGTPEYQRERWLRTTHKLVWADYLKMIEDQCGSCKICGHPSDNLHVDHNHKCCPGIRSCGKCIRGLLCKPCNQAIGFFGDDPDRMESGARYVRGD